ncbi:putative Late embryoproteinsis abundant hydroxyproline-rich glycofamily protein [Hibiscus syriacus]|uniref:Late embryoproteinsis abundant hydroxyproline-rich glycofamily protein n=1 Tax=Hibiscus syriacus TaxID=106335 RepID=A0A6A2WDS0_HIBSY|nr:putative Late embryoproteinsis abundant hydroxyproline-rich glycofamily protein [Hibiscus syriacus]
MAEQSYQHRETEMESAAEASKELKLKKRMKLIFYASAFAIFQTVVILVFSLTVMRIKNPKFRVHSITVEHLTASSAPNPPSFNIKLNAQVAVKNTNFGHFKFQNTTISFDYGGVGVGDAFVAKGRSKARSTLKMNVTVELNSNNIVNNSSLTSDIESGFLALSCHSKLSGKVQLMKLIKKKKSAEMGCAILVNLVTRDQSCPRYQLPIEFSFAIS